MRGLKKGEYAVGFTSTGGSEDQNLARVFNSAAFREEVERSPTLGIFINAGMGKDKTVWNYTIQGSNTAFETLAAQGILPASMADTFAQAAEEIRKYQEMPWLQRSFTMPGMIERPVAEVPAGQKMHLWAILH